MRRWLAVANSTPALLHGFLVFEVSWRDVHGINYYNDLLTDTSLALEARYLNKWEFYSAEQAAGCASQWFLGGASETQSLRGYLLHYHHHHHHHRRPRPRPRPRHHHLSRSSASAGEEEEAPEDVMMLAASSSGDDKSTPTLRRRMSWRSRARRKNDDLQLQLQQQGQGQGEREEEGTRRRCGCSSSSIGGTATRCSWSVPVTRRCRSRSGRSSRRTSGC
ncbi:hypothetical protein ZWY2020_059980 [Hordeum vulgare]|nr:hypothetical protein ZWY2020_059980 [Hordeum vulgare]